MGCVQAKPYATNSPPLAGLEKVKLDNGYVTGGREGAHISRKQPGKDPGRRYHQNGSVKKVGAVGGGREAQKERDVNGGGGGVKKVGVVNGGGEAQKESDVNGGGRRGNVVKKVRSVKKKNIEGYELVSGWPKWLVDNISEDVLAGLVPKSADSYEKLAKVLNFELSPFDFRFLSFFLHNICFWIWVLSR